MKILLAPFLIIFSGLIKFIDCKGELRVLDETSWSDMLEGECFAPWCLACQQVQPVWEEFAKWSDDLGIKVGSVDVTLNPEREELRPIVASSTPKPENSAPKIVLRPSALSVQAEKIKSMNKYDLSSTRSSVSRCDSAAKKKALATPNFKKIHARAFEKLESIDEFQKRMEESTRKIKKAAPKVTRATTKIATFGGISFVPSVRPSALKPKLNISTNKNSGAAARSFLSQAETAAKKKSVATPTAARSFLSQAETAAKKKSVATPTPIQSKTDAENSMKKKKFDLKASLSRKLGYKPYTGPLKPLAESNKLDTSLSCLHKPKESENIIVKQKRLQNRTTLKGVRTNKRFELQMKNRQRV